MAAYATLRNPHASPSDLLLGMCVAGRLRDDGSGPTMWGVETSTPACWLGRQGLRHPAFPRTALLQGDGLAAPVRLRERAPHDAWARGWRGGPWRFECRASHTSRTQTLGFPTSANPWPMPGLSYDPGFWPAVKGRGYEQGKPTGTPTGPSRLSSQLTVAPRAPASLRLSGPPTAYLHSRQVTKSHAESIGRGVPLPYESVPAPWAGIGNAVMPVATAACKDSFQTPNNG